MLFVARPFSNLLENSHDYYMINDYSTSLNTLFAIKPREDVSAQMSKAIFHTHFSDLEQTFFHINFEFCTISLSHLEKFQRGHRANWTQITEVSQEYGSI